LRFASRIAARSRADATVHLASASLLALSTSASTPLVVPSTPPRLKVLRRPVESAQYCSGLFQDTLKAYGMRSSMSRRGDCWDNAPTESLWGSLKVARMHGRHFATRRAAMDEVIDWLGFYNARRLHSTLDYVSPMTFEKNWLAAQQGQAA
jgi:hypothetical protein